MATGSMTDAGRRIRFVCSRRSGYFSVLTLCARRPDALKLLCFINLLIGRALVTTRAIA